MADDEAKPHHFHAEAHALDGRLDLPFKEEIKKQAFVKLEGPLEGLSDAEKAQRSYFSQHAKNFRLEGIISYAAAHTQVSGHKSSKHDGASVTLATSVVEDLNVLNVVTADRVVAQISTTHFPDRYSPEVTFLGTHFENLRIARHKAEPFLKLDLCSERLAGDDMRVHQDDKFTSIVAAQYKRLKARLTGLNDDDKKKMRLDMPDHSLLRTYHGGALDFAAVKDEAGTAQKKEDSTWDGIVCSLVENVDIKDISVKNAEGNSVQIPPPGTSFGHVIHIPDFGTVFLAELRVNHNSYNLTMIRLELGCLADGTVGLVSCNVNGKGKPPAP
jgi:hypothetical protein